jgi:hypothetical protein
MRGTGARAFPPRGQKFSSRSGRIAAILPGTPFRDQTFGLRSNGLKSVKRADDKHRPPTDFAPSVRRGANVSPVDAD